jgi:18S rRNA (guanine1575-N7)-methyltransferase
MFVGLDIAPSMLEIAAERDDVNGDLFLWDMGQGLSFRPGMFDGAVSISAVQWLCNADRKENNPVQRINRFFQSLYVSLARGARAVLQLYPESPNQVELLTSAAMRAGFGGGLVVDFPNSTRAKKSVSTTPPTPSLTRLN